MATKLTSSLRKSISAEKETVEQKTTPRKKPAVKKPIAAAKPTVKPAIAAKKTTAPEVAVPEVVKPNVAIPDGPTKPTTQNHSQPAVQLSSYKTPDFNFKLQASSVDATKLLNSIAVSNQKIIDSALQTIQAVNQDLTNYIYQIVEPSNLSDIVNLNTELMTKLRLRQESFWQNSFDIFNQIVKIK